MQCEGKRKHEVLFAYLRVVVTFPLVLFFLQSSSLCSDGAGVPNVHACHPKVLLLCMQAIEVMPIHNV